MRSIVAPFTRFQLKHGGGARRREEGGAEQAVEDGKSDVHEEQGGAEAEPGCGWQGGVGRRCSVNHPDRSC